MQPKEIKKAYRRSMNQALEAGVDLPEWIDMSTAKLKEKLNEEIATGSIDPMEAMNLIIRHDQLMKEVLGYGKEHGLKPLSKKQRCIKAIDDIMLDTKYGFRDIVFGLRKRFGSKGELQKMINELNPDTLKDTMETRCKYVCSADIAMNIYVALALGKPLLVEGPPGCGKTELAKVLSTIFNTKLIRLQCYDGIDATHALYEWNYQKQILDIQRGKGDGNIFGEDYLLERPLLQALREEPTPVLLIDEVDKVDQEFEAHLLEILSDFQVSIPEYGTVIAKKIPPVILTSNGVRDLGDALRRRCVYLWVGFPTIDKEATILMKKTDTLRPNTALQIARIMSVIRNEVNLLKQPSVSESLDLAAALTNMGIRKIESPLLDQLTTLFLKNREDLDKMQERGGAKWLLERA